MDDPEIEKLASSALTGQLLTCRQVRNIMMFVVRMCSAAGVSLIAKVELGSTLAIL